MGENVIEHLNINISGNTTELQMGFGLNNISLRNDTSIEKQY